MQSLFGLEGKRIMVVGGGQGMGEATVQLLTQLGCNVAIVDLEPDRAARVASSVSGKGTIALPFNVDVTNDEALVAMVSKIEHELGPLDGMASIVGMAGWSPIVDMTNETWDLDHRRNLRYFFIAAREVARSMLKRNAPGSIVAVASVDGIRSARNHAAYGAAKAGLINLVKSMAVEWSDNGIRVNAVAPGAIITPRLPFGGEEKERNAMDSVPMKRRGAVDDIAKAAAFFLSDLSPYVTGQTLAVDGGFTAASVFKNTAPVPKQGTLGIDGAS